MSLFIKAILFLIPILMIIFGVSMWFFPPQSKNRRFAYRSQKSMRNEETWEYAQICMGKTWFIVGIVLVFVTMFLIPRLALSSGSLLIVMLSIQVVFLFLPFAWIEFLLTRKFK
ncbi:MAG: SdpI family protein [Longibaculum sp.]